MCDWVIHILLSPYSTNSFHCLLLKRQILIYWYGQKDRNGSSCILRLYIAHKKWSGKLMWLFTLLRFEIQCFCCLNGKHINWVSSVDYWSVLFWVSCFCIFLGGGVGCGIMVKCIATRTMWTSFKSQPLNYPSRSEFPHLCNED